MSTDLITNTASTTPTTQTGVKAASDKGTTLDDLSSDFETFLKMMTAQAQYQDPLEPMDSSEYASQLAQFSMVEQQVQTNEALTNMLMTQQAASLLSWVGMEVRTSGPGWFDGQMITVQPSVSDNATSATLVVRNEAGDVVQSLGIPTTGDSFQWAGIDDTGAVLPSGNYTFEVESYRDVDLIQTKTAETYAKVTEVQVEGSTHSLILSGGKKMSPDEVTAMRS